MKARLDRRHGQPEGFTDLPIRQPVEIAQYHHRLIHRRELIERLLECPLDLGGAQVSLRILRPVNDGSEVMSVFLIPRQIIIEGNFFASLSATKLHESRIQGKPVEPGGEGRVAAKRLRLLVNRQKNLLDDFFGLLRIPDKFGRLTVDRTYVPTIQGFEGLLIASFHPLDQQAVLIIRSVFSNAGYGSFFCSPVYLMLRAHDRFTL